MVQPRAASNSPARMARLDVHGHEERAALVVSKRKREPSPGDRAVLRAGKIIKLYQRIYDNATASFAQPEGPKTDSGDGIHSSYEPDLPGEVPLVSVDVSVEQELSSPDDQDSPAAYADIPRPAATVIDNQDYRADFEDSLGLDEATRTDHVHWILTALPMPPKSKSKQERESYRELRDQLTGSPETRFCAAHMFLRYMHALSKETLGNGQFLGVVVQGRDYFLQDAALACLAITVKADREAIEEFYPIHVSEYVRMARSESTVDDLKCAERAIVNILQFNAATDSPAAYIEEIHQGCGSPLERVLLLEDDLWERVEDGVYERLYGALYDLDVLKFPVYLLTAAAFLEALTDAMQEVFCRPLSKSPFISDDVKKLGMCRKMAEPEVELVKLEVQQLCGVTEADLKHCRQWLASVTV
ncbi:hypothetical protein OE88DRAFT_1735123 [Heliocybe sulcata]|uniref:Uncharacterized protein n=1 Tax=Heliocybe sulcata TaxID=5364 RepID=A0A5C3N2A2_9AGAM|nr:hypothetical protein OE88DRAFT_1735123 [Heliocybe sulcata]